MKSTQPINKSVKSASKKSGYRGPFIAMIIGILALAGLVIEIFLILGAAQTDKSGDALPAALLISFVLLLSCAIPLAVIISAGVILIKRRVQNSKAMA